MEPVSWCDLLSLELWLQWWAESLQLAEPLLLLAMWEKSIQAFWKKHGPCFGNNLHPQPASTTSCLATKTSGPRYLLESQHCSEPSCVASWLWSYWHWQDWPDDLRLVVFLQVAQCRNQQLPCCYENPNVPQKYTNDIKWHLISLIISNLIFCSGTRSHHLYGHRRDTKHGRSPQNHPAQCTIPFGMGKEPGCKCNVVQWGNYNLIQYGSDSRCFRKKLLSGPSSNIFQQWKWTRTY